MRARMEWMGWLWMGLGAACGPSSEVDKDASEVGSEGSSDETEAPEDSAGDGDDGDDGDADSEPGPEDDQPTVVVLDATCSVYVSGDTRVVWSVEGTASDPQGADTLLTVVSDGLVASLDGTEVVRSALSCSVVDLSEAYCTGTFGQWDDATTCDGAASVAVWIEVEDEDGNRAVSDPVAGRAE